MYETRYIPKYDYNNVTLPSRNNNPAKDPNRKLIIIGVPILVAVIALIMAITARADVSAGNSPDKADTAAVAGVNVAAPTAAPNSNTDPASDATLADYQASGYKMIKQISNPTGNYDLVVLGEQSSLGTDASSCGTTTKALECFFYSKAHTATGDAQTLHYLGKWKGGLDYMIVSTLKFINSTTAEFRSSGSDGSMTQSATVRIDLANSKITESGRATLGGVADHD